MSRLTEYHCGVAVIKDKNKLKDAMQKLARYEELEEKGIPMELLFMVGEKAYHVIEDNIANPPIYISEHEIKDVSGKAVYFANDWWTFEEIKEMNVFFTKAEAEKALAEMEKNNG